MKIISIFFKITLLSLLTFVLNAQNVSGNLSLLADQSIKLEGFKGLKTYPISSSTIDDKGNFKLTYAKTDFGVGYLMSADNKPYFVILSGENIRIEGAALSQVESLKITEGTENQAFARYAIEHPRREQALSAWKYLEKIYLLDSLFALQQVPKSAIEK